MNDCSIKIYFDKKILKGAGLKDSTYLPAWIYNLKIVIKNNTEYFKICSLNSTLANGLTYFKNLKVTGKDEEIIDYVNIIEPNKKTGNDNVIVFANNFKLSPLSENIISFDVALSDRYTQDSLENSGDKIPHKSKLIINSYLLCDSLMYSDKIICEAMDYIINIGVEDSQIKVNDETKLYIECKAGQYDLIRKVYLKCSINSGLKYITQTSNLEPNKMFTYDNRTILIWNFNNINQCECIKIGFKVKLKDMYNDLTSVKIGDNIGNSINSNGANNSTYTQCYDSDKCIIVVN